MAKRNLDQIGPRKPTRLPSRPAPVPVAPTPTPIKAVGRTPSVNGPYNPQRSAPKPPVLAAAPAAKPAPKPDPELAEDEEWEEYEENAWQSLPFWTRLSISLFGLAILLVASFELVYAGKIYPGITADGAYIGGQSRSEATKRITKRTADFSGQVVTISDGDTNLRIPVSSLGVSYDTAKAVDRAFNYGRQGSLWDKITQQGRALIGQATNISTYQYDNAKLVPYLVQLEDDLISPVQNAALSFNDNRAQVTPAEAGTRVDRGRLIQLVSSRLAEASSDPVAAPVYKIAPDLDTAPLQDATGQLDRYLAGPVTLTFSGVEHVVDQPTIVSWIQIGSKPNKPFLRTLKLEDIFTPPAAVSLGLDQTALKAYVAELAKAVDQTPQNAALVMQDGQITVAEPSRNGVKLNQPDGVKAIEAALARPADNRSVALELQTTTADVNENNLASLGIKELISTGETFFPGSPSTRLTNVRAGAKRFNGILLKPDQVFSFGALLGAVGPETGYVPELVILNNHEEKQYGGGLCQVSSTAFRAALAAGLPILERHNHSFAISYYTAPYNAPGVDATIYYPQVDFKFKNDTGSYILMQTTMQGTTLKFDFYGTKTKSGTVRGPEFITGNNDATKPSHTVFYRDVLDMSGKVTKTDTFHTYYKSSLDFPITPQFN